MRGGTGECRCIGCVSCIRKPGDDPNIRQDNHKEAQEMFNALLPNMRSTVSKVRRKASKTLEKALDDSYKPCSSNGHAPSQGRPVFAYCSSCHSHWNGESNYNDVGRIKWDGEKEKYERANPKASSGYEDGESDGFSGSDEDEF